MRGIVPIAVFLLFAALSATAQDTSEVEKLRATVEELQKTVQELQQRVKQLETERLTGEAAKEPPAETPPEKVSESALVRDHDAVSDQQPAAPRPDNAPLDPELKGFVPIPGTVSMFKFGGSARVDTIYDTGDNGHPNWFVPSTMPVEGEAGYESGERSALHGKGTRMSLEFRRPTGENDSLRIYYENDFFGDSSSSAMTYRLRHFYGQASNILAGQTYSGFQNVDSWPDVIDNLGPSAMVNRRQAQIRYTRPYSHHKNLHQSVYLSAELPSTEIDVNGDLFPDGTRTVSSVPDFVAGYRHVRASGLMQLAVLGRHLAVEEPGGERRSTTGWGVNLSGAIHLFESGRVSYQVVYGEGIGRYLNDTNGQNVDAAPGTGGALEAVPLFAPMIGYGHKWSEKWRSTVSYAVVQRDIPDSLGDSATESTTMATLNLIYQPTKSFRLGVEYLYGDRETAGGAKGDGDRVDFVVKYDLVK